MPQPNEKMMDIESPGSKEDQNLLLAPWGNHHIMFANGETSPRLHKAPSSIFSFAPKFPGAGSNGKRYFIQLFSAERSLHKSEVMLMKLSKEKLTNMSCDGYKQ